MSGRGDPFPAILFLLQECSPELHRNAEDRKQACRDAGAGNVFGLARTGETEVRAADERQALEGR